MFSDKTLIIMIYHHLNEIQKTRRGAGGSLRNLVSIPIVLRTGAYINHPQFSGLLASGHDGTSALVILFNLVYNSDHQILGAWFFQWMTPVNLAYSSLF